MTSRKKFRLRIHRLSRELLQKAHTANAFLNERQLELFIASLPLRLIRYIEKKKK